MFLLLVRIEWRDCPSGRADFSPAGHMSEIRTGRQKLTIQASRSQKLRQGFIYPMIVWVHGGQVALRLSVRKRFCAASVLSAVQSTDVEARTMCPPCLAEGAERFASTCRVGRLLLTCCGAID